MSFLWAINDRFDPINDETQANWNDETRELTEVLASKSPIVVKWVYKKKFKPNGVVDRFKARQVTKEYQQKPEMDYFEVFAPVAS